MEQATSGETRVHELRLAVVERRLLKRLPVVRDEPLRRHTSYRIGGPADLFVRVSSVDDLAMAVRCASEEGIPHFILGGGTNILVGDRGYRGLVIKNCAQRWHVERFSNWPYEVGQGECSETQDRSNVYIYAESGVGLAQLAREMIHRGFGGLTWAEGIPGTIGGGIVGNAGAFGSSMADITRQVEWMAPRGERERWGTDQLCWGYRYSRFKEQPELTVLAAWLNLSRENASLLRESRDEYGRRRRDSQPGGASAGSVFRNPPASFAGRLIEQAGLKGRRIGGAFVSEKHANFVINDGSATAADVRALIDLVRDEVARRFGDELQLEIQMVGEF